MFTRIGTFLAIHLGVLLFLDPAFAYAAIQSSPVPVHSEKTAPNTPSRIESGISREKQKPVKKKRGTAPRKIREIPPLPKIWIRHIRQKEFQKLLDEVAGETSDLGGRRQFLEGYALFQLKRYREAVAKWEKALTRIPDLRIHILHFIAKAADALRDDDLARNSLEKILRLRPTGPHADEAHETLAGIALRRDLPLEAARWYKRLLQRFPNHEKAATFLTKRAQALEAAGRNRDAAVAWRTLWAKYPENSDSDKALERARELAFGTKPPLRSIGASDHFYRARKLQRSYFYQKAFGAYQELKRLFPNSPFRRQIALQEALTLYSLRRTEKAESALENALRLFPSDTAIRAKARFYLSRNYLRRRNQNSFKSEVRTLLEESPKGRWAARARYLMARVHEDDLDYDAAERYYREVIDHHPNSRFTPLARWQLSWIQLQRKANLDAYKGFRRLANRFPQHELTPSALFWSAAAAERAGEREKAALQYQKSVRLFRHMYYGQLSAKALRRLARENSSIPASVPPPRTAGYRKWTKRPRGPFSSAAQSRWRAAEMLASMGFNELAAEEYLRLGPSEYFQFHAALAYSRDGQHGKAIRILHSQFLNSVQAGGMDLPLEFWKISFPLMAKKRIAGGADPLLVNAIIKAESLFDQNAFSSAGAVGLMQLLPATGRRVAKKIKLRLTSTDQLFQPEINIRLGAYHLGELVRDFKGELVPAIASYNAGRRPVRMWWRNRNNEPIETFIERIPYQETRNYVKKVIGYLEEYRRIYGIRNGSSERLTR